MKFLFRPLIRYTRWLHTRWPAGTVEKFPEIGEDGCTNVPGLYITGDLTGIPLLKFSCDSGARVVQTILDDSSFQATRDKKPAGVKDLIIVGAGVSGMAAALEARKAGLDFVVYEANQSFSTIVNFPKGKPIYTYPQEMVPVGSLQVKAEVKEALVEELLEQTRDIPVIDGHVESVVRKSRLLEARIGGKASVRSLRVIVAIGRSGDFRKLGIPGEDLDKVYNRLHDPQDYCRLRVLVVGGGSQHERDRCSRWDQHRFPVQLLSQQVRGHRRSRRPNRRRSHGTHRWRAVV